MFVLVELRDTVSVPPRKFNIKLHDAVSSALNKKFANKVIYNVGLCIALWDITKMDDSFIFPGDGASHTVVEFRFVVFKPFIDEVLEGAITSSSKDGINVSMGFFDDIFIPADNLQNPSRFDEQQQQWIWEYDDGSQKNFMEMERNQKIRFSVVLLKFVDLTPTGPEKFGEAAVLEATEKEKKSPFTLICSAKESGMGMLSWWTYPTDDS